MNDLDRLRNEYADRKNRFADKNIYTWFDPSNLFILQQRQRALISALQKEGIDNLSRQIILEIGCGAGGVLTEFLNFGAAPQNLHGVDLLEDRLFEAKKKLPASHFINADARNIPLPGRFFDIVMQFTALSSVLDENIKQEIAKEMMRVLKPGGVMIWYDFWLNPLNRQTRGIRPAEIRRLFPACAIKFIKITLAPPMARRIVPASWVVALILEKIGVFNSHYLAIINPLTAPKT